MRVNRVLLKPKISELWIDAVQAAIFNQVLAIRLEKGTMPKMLAGDIAWNHAISRYESGTVSEGDVRDSVMLDAVKGIRLSATGPLYGRRMPLPGENIQAIESLGAERAKLNAVQLQEQGGSRRGDRRPLRVPVHNPQVESGRDERHGSYIKISFELPKGAYATGVLSEIMGIDAVEERGWWNAVR